MKTKKKTNKPPEYSETYHAYAILVNGKTEDFFVFNLQSTPIMFKTRTEATKNCIEFRKHLGGPCRVVKISAEYKML